MTTQNCILHDSAESTCDCPPGIAGGHGFVWCEEIDIAPSYPSGAIDLMIEAGIAPGEKGPFVQVWRRTCHLAGWSDRSWWADRIIGFSRKPEPQVPGLSAKQAEICIYRAVVSEAQRKSREVA